MSAGEGTEIRRRSGARVAVLVCGAVVVQAAAGAPARACSRIAPPPALTGMPADGATGIPTDVRPFFDAYAAYVDGTQPAQLPTFQLTSDTGAVVALAFQLTYPSQTFELVPAAELAPLTTYTLTEHWPAPTDSTPASPDLTLSFTTGAGPVGASPPPPVASMEHYSLPGSQPSACQPLANSTCVFFPAGTVVEASYSYPGGPLGSRELHAQPFFTNLTGINQGTPFTCVSLRTRAPNGSMSDPAAVLCGADARTLNLRGNGDLTCTSQGIGFAGGVASVQTSGCAVGGGPRRPVGAPLLAALAGLALLARRRRGRP